MIIDVHRHIVDKNFYSDKYWRGLAQLAAPILKRMGADMTLDAIIENIFPVYYDTDGEKHIAAMDEAGVDKTVMLLFDCGLIAGEGEVSIEKQNEIVFQVAKRYPERIIPFVSIDPRRKNAKEFVKKAIEEWGARGLKLHPGSGMNPEAKETLELIESICDSGIPVLVHTGASMPPTSSRYCDPIYLDEMLLKFPEVNVIAAHMGYGYRTQLFPLAQNRPNLYVDIAAWQSVAAHRYNEFAEVIRSAIDHTGPEKILFGTDNPYLWPVLPEPGYVQAIKDLSAKPPEGVRLTEEEIKMLLGENAKTLFDM